MPPIGTAAGQLQPVFNQATQAVQAQAPAIQNLYNALMQGLQGQLGNQVQNVVQSAERRGVGRAMLGADTQNMLGQELALQAGQLGVQRAQDLATNQQALGNIGVQRGTSIVDLAQSLQADRQTTQKAKMDLKNTERDFQLRNQQALRDLEVAKTAQATANARVAARASASAGANQKTLLDISGSDLERMTRLGLDAVQGKDGFVSPENLAKAYNDYRRAGFSSEDFWSRFQGKWNPNQADYSDQFYYHVNRGS